MFTFRIIKSLYKWGSDITLQSYSTLINLYSDLAVGECSFWTLPSCVQLHTSFLTVFSILLSKTILVNRTERHAQALHASDETKRSFSTDSFWNMRTHSRHSCHGHISAIHPKSALLFSLGHSSMISQYICISGSGMFMGFGQTFKNDGRFSTLVCS